MPATPSTVFNVMLIEIPPMVMRVRNKSFPHGFFPSETLKIVSASGFCCRLIYGYSVRHRRKGDGGKV